MSRIDITQNQLFVPTVGYSVHQLVTNRLYTLALNNSVPLNYYRRIGAKKTENAIDEPAQIGNQKETEFIMDSDKFHIELDDELLTSKHLPYKDDAPIDRQVQRKRSTQNMMFGDHEMQIQDTSTVEKDDTNRGEAKTNKLKGVSPQYRESTDAKLKEKLKKLQKTTNELLGNMKSLIRLNKNLCKEVVSLKKRLTTAERKQRRENDAAEKHFDEVKTVLNGCKKSFEKELNNLRSQIRNLLPCNADNVSSRDKSNERNKKLARKHDKLKTRLQAVEKEWEQYVAQQNYAFCNTPQQTEEEHDLQSHHRRHNI